MLDLVAHQDDTKGPVCFFADDQGVGVAPHVDGKAPLASLIDGDLSGGPH